MAFSWAYIDCNTNLVEGPGGPTGSVQFRDGNRTITGSAAFTFITGAAPTLHKLYVTGNLIVSGAISASAYVVQNTVKTITHLTLSGDTKHGDTIDDLHEYTGSLNVSASAPGGAHSPALFAAPTDAYRISSPVGQLGVGIVPTQAVTISGSISASAGSTFGATNAFTDGGVSIITSGSIQTHYVSASAGSTFGATNAFTDTGVSIATSGSIKTAYVSASAGSTFGATNIFSKADLSIVASGSVQAHYISASAGSTFGATNIFSKTGLAVIASGSIQAHYISASAASTFAGTNEFTKAPNGISIEASGTIRSKHSITGAGSISGQDLTIAGGTGFTVNNAGVVSSSGGATFLGPVIANSTLNVSGTLSASMGITASNHIVPEHDAAYNLGEDAKRWANIYTADLHMKNDRGDWTIIEEEDYLSIRNNKNGKLYKFVLEEIED